MLIRSVTQAIPAFTRLVIQLPKVLCEQLDAVIKRFQWNPKSKSGSYLTPIAWSSLCWPQKYGGLGFRSSLEFSQALLPKIAWWTPSKKDCPCINLLRAKYRVRGNWLAHQISSSSSPIWRSIAGTKQIISRGACILVGNGNFIGIWNDPWILDLSQFIPRPKEDANIDNALIVSQLLRQDRCNWDTQKLRELFDDDTIVHIWKIPISSF